jgi:hypothetical protein
VPDVSDFTLRPLSGAGFISVQIANFVTTELIARSSPRAQPFRFYWSYHPPPERSRPQASYGIGSTVTRQRRAAAFLDGVT